MKFESLNESLGRWRLDELLQKYSGLRLAPVVDNMVKIAGSVRFEADVAGKNKIIDAYQVEILIPLDFPRSIPSVRETAGRIPPDFHKLRDGSLCLGSPIWLRLLLLMSPTLTSFVERCLIPYLYGRSYYEWHGEMPFGELEHGRKGIVQDLAELFGTTADAGAVGYARLAGMRKRLANKERCPCGSGLRLGRCHRGIVNSLRKRLGRFWFRWAFESSR